MTRGHKLDANSSLGPEFDPSFGMMDKDKVQTYDWKLSKCVI